MSLERNFQKDFIKELKARFPDAIVLKNDSGYCQGIPDLTVLRKNGWWALLEMKKSMTAPYRPNQEYYLQEADKMSFSATIYPENKEDVLDAMEKSYQRHCRRISRVS